MNAQKTLLDMPQPTGLADIRQAVVALEMGPADEAVLDYVCFLATRIPVHAIRFLHVLPSVDLYHALYEKELQSLVSNYTLEDELRNKIREMASRRLENALDTELSVDIREGSPLKALLECARESSADLVVIGQQAGTAHHGILARNMARQVAGNALVVPSRTTNRLRRLMVPVDFSDASGRALRHALALREQMDVRPDILAVHLFEVPRLNLHQLATPKHKLRELIARDREASFKHFLKRWAPRQEQVVQIVLQERDHKDTGKHLMQIAKDDATDLIVLGAKGHTGVELLLLGSVAERILELNQQTPTLVVR